MPPVDGRFSAQTPGDAPRLAWGRVWLFALILIACSVTGLEAFWQVQGYRPNVPDSMELWYFWRQQVDRDNGKVIVFLGSSRVTADISIDALRESLPDYRIVQLGMSGAVSCIGLLQELSGDPNFKGTVVCELDTPLLERSLWDGHRDYRTYHPSNWRNHLEELVWASLADHLVILQHPFGLGALVARFVYDGRSPARNKLRIRFSREIQWDFANVPDLEELRRKTTEQYAQTYTQHRFPSLETLSRNIDAINVMVRNVQRHGGQVVFLRAPSTGERWRLEERFHPKKNWDLFAASTSAICIHFRDVSGIADLKCPDESHLDFRDSPVFTRAVLIELKARGWSR